MKLLSIISIVVVGVSLSNDICIANHKHEEKLIFAPLYKGGERLILSQHPIAGTARLALLTYGVKQSGIVSPGYTYDPNTDQEKSVEYDKQDMMVLFGTHLGLRYLGNTVEDYCHKQGYDLESVFMN